MEKTRHCTNSNVNAGKIRWRETNLIESQKKINVKSDFKLGTLIEVVGTTNKQNQNRSGNLVNVSKNMIFLKEVNTRKVIRIAKNEVCVYRTDDSPQTHKLPGKRLLGRPEEVVV